MTALRQSTARTILIGPVLDADGAAKTDEVVANIRITKNGTVGSANGSTTLTHDHAGKYKLAMATGDSDTVGILEISLNSGTNDMPMNRFNVMEEAAYDALYAAGAAGNPIGEGAYTGTLTVDDGATGLEGVVVNARRGGVLKASGTTDASGEITDWVFGAYTYTFAARLAGYQPETDTLAVTGDAWTKTISLTAISITAPSAASLCTVQFRVQLSGVAVEGAVCKAKSLGINQASDGVILSNAESSDTTDALGIAELELVQKGSIVKGSGLYKIWVEIAGQPVASVETSIPNQATILFEDML